MQRLGKYEIVSELGRGGMGVVYKARDPFINRLVALKTITGNLASNNSLLERFYQEARSAGTLQHPNIVTIYELGEAKGAPFIAMEYIEGETLEGMISRKAVLPLVVKLGHMVRASEGLAYAHEHGVIHRDIKPGNIMVTSEGVAKIVDFGIARVMDVTMTQANMVIGSRAYMAPQLYSGERADARSDIWALGATLFELLTYQKPFASETEAGLMFKVLNENPPPLRTLCPDATDALENILKKMLEQSSSERYQNMRDVVRDLGGIWRQAQEEAVQILLGESRQSMEARDFGGAQELLRRALQIDITNLAAKSLLDQVSRELRRIEIHPRVQEHLNRGRSSLGARKLAEARAEVESALSLDPLHDPARSLLKEVEEAMKSAEQLERHLRHAKQRLAEGALTDAREVLQQAAKLDVEEPRMQELLKQIAEEEGRRERQRQLAKLQDQARGLWMELKYAECLAVLEEGLTRYPDEVALLKLRETARQDWEEQEKQQQLGRARKLLARQEFAHARSILDQLRKLHPGDSAVNKLRALVEEGELELKQQERLVQELAGLRGLVSEEKFAEALARGESFLLEYPKDFELKELVGYARAELAQQQLRRKEQEKSKLIQGLLQAKRYAEAATSAQQAVREFGGHQGFQTLWEEAEKKRKEQEARDEYQKRIRDIQQRINRQELTDAIDLAQQTLTTLGPDAQVSRLLQAAKVEQEGKNRQGAEARLDAVQTLVDGGQLADATRMLNDAFATQILQPSHPGARQLLTLIEKISSDSQAKPKQTPSGKMKSIEATDSLPYSATNVINLTPPPDTPPLESAEIRLEPKRRLTPAAAGPASASGAATSLPRTQVRQDRSASPWVKGDPRKSAAEMKLRVMTAVSLLQRQLLPAAQILKSAVVSERGTPKRKVFLAGAITLLAIVGAGIGIPAWRSHRTSQALSAREGQLSAEALRLWQENQPDRAEEKWKQVQALHGASENKAALQIAEIEAKRADEQAQFDEANRLDKNDPQGRQKMQAIADLHLWHAADAQSALNTLDQSIQSAKNISEQEQQLFQQGEQLFGSGNYDPARRRFRDMVGLQVPNSILVPKAQTYLSKIRALNDDKKNYDAAMEDMQNENLDAARDGFRAVVDHKGLLKDDARKQLDKIASVQTAVGAISDIIRSHSYRVAKSRIDGMQEWPKSSSRLRQALISTEQEEFDSIKSRAQILLQKQDSTALEHMQDELDNFSGRAEDTSALRAAEELQQNLNKQIPQMKKELSSDNQAFNKAEKDYQQAREGGDINRLGTDVLHEFELIARGNGYNHTAAQGYVAKVIPDTIRELTQNLSSKGKTVVPPISCGPGSKPTLESKGQMIACAKLDSDSPLRWIGNPTIDMPPDAKQAGKLPYTLHLIVVIDGNGKIIRVDKDGPADQDFLKKAKESAKGWHSTNPLLNGKPVNTSFQIEVTFHP